MRRGKEYHHGKRGVRKYPPKYDDYRTSLIGEIKGPRRTHTRKRDSKRRYKQDEESSFDSSHQHRENQHTETLNKTSCEQEVIVLSDDDQSCNQSQEENYESADEDSLTLKINTLPQKNKADKLDQSQENASKHPQEKASKHPQEKEEKEFSEAFQASQEEKAIAKDLPVPQQEEVVKEQEKTTLDTQEKEQAIFEWNLPVLPNTGNSQMSLITEEENHSQKNNILSQNCSVKPENENSTKEFLVKQQVPDRICVNQPIDETDEIEITSKSIWREMDKIPEQIIDKEVPPKIDTPQAESGIIPEKQVQIPMVQDSDSVIPLEGPPDEVPLGKELCYEPYHGIFLKFTFPPENAFNGLQLYLQCARVRSRIIEPLTNVPLRISQKIDYLNYEFRQQYQMSKVLPRLFNIQDNPSSNKKLSKWQRNQLEGLLKKHFEFSLIMAKFPEKLPEHFAISWQENEENHSKLMKHIPKDKDIMFVCCKEEFDFILLFKSNLLTALPHSIILIKVPKLLLRAKIYKQSSYGLPKPNAIVQKKPKVKKPSESPEQKPSQLFERLIMINTGLLGVPEDQIRDMCLEEDPSRGIQELSRYFSQKFKDPRIKDIQLYEEKITHMQKDHSDTQKLYSSLLERIKILEEKERQDKAKIQDLNIALKVEKEKSKLCQVRPNANTIKEVEEIPFDDIKPVIPEKPKNFDRRASGLFDKETGLCRQCICNICRENPCILFLPCKHAVQCEECYKRTIPKDKGYGKCKSCKKSVKDVISIEYIKFRNRNRKV
ncbi:unnamed protein product [Moneuplotes crassus]|uniref:RING-type domain-containing protein n=1 Tax=Euplotes crassus TaxID=5936 RepID=A0AAD1Y4B3_EUPCR|nr:unnamed protein product [Moneuplotes crassus]